MPIKAVPNRVSNRTASKKPKLIADVLSGGVQALMYPSPRRGRPRKPVSPEVLLPYQKQELAAADRFEKLRDKSVDNPKPAKRGNRFRRINPVTCDRHYSPEETEFMTALDEYKRLSGHPFPTCSEVLAVLKGLGYAKGVPQE